MRPLAQQAPNHAYSTDFSGSSHRLFRADGMQYTAGGADAHPGTVDGGDGHGNACAPDRAGRHCYTTSRAHSHGRGDRDSGAPPAVSISCADDARRQPNAGAEARSAPAGNAGAGGQNRFSG